MTHAKTASGYSILAPDGSVVVRIRTTETVGAPDTVHPDKLWIEKITAIPYARWTITFTGRNFLVSDLTAIMDEIAIIKKL